MRALLLLSLLALARGAPREACTETNCALPNCFCSGTDIPGGLDPKDVPQMVMLTYDDDINTLNFNNYYSQNLFNRQNPDGCNITTTFFCSHEYNEYSKTYKLYRQGHEIALHSITHQADQDYWRDATVAQLKDEYIGEREIITKFGKVPAEAMKGMRAPFLQNAGNNAFEMMKENGLEWDCSWPTRDFADPPMWPYTLDYTSEQDCPIPPCPTASFPGIWEVPMVDWFNGEFPCSMVDACLYISDPDELLEFIKMNFHRHYDSNRAPFPFFMHSAWFASLPMRFDVYNKFLDYLKDMPDVYIVSISKVIEWIKNPTPLAQMNGFWKCWEIPANDCPKSRSCELIREDTGEIRYLDCCVACPDVYPWLGNPNGEIAENDPK